MQTKYTLSHLYILLLLLLTGGYYLLWLFYYKVLIAYPSEEFILLLFIYLIMVIVTAFVYSTTNLFIIHQKIGIRVFKLRLIALPVLIAIGLWVINYLFQSYLLSIDFNDLAYQWYKDKDLFITLISMVILAPLIEEMLFRGVMLQTLNKHLNQFWSIFIVSALFTWIHASLIDAPILFIASLFYAWLTFKYKSIIPSIIAHIVNNLITFIFYLRLISI